MTTTSTPPNWYPDPQTPGQMRWWDGASWTDHTTADRSAAPAPYAAPGAAGWRPPLTPATVTLGVAARWLVVAAGVIAVADLFTNVSALQTVSGWVDDPSTVSMDAATSIDQLALVFGSLSVVTTLATAIVLITWLYRVYTSDRVDPTELRHSPGWVIGGWFVPVLSLWRPAQVVRDLWHAATLDEGREHRGVPGARPVPALVRWWWAAFLVMNVSSTFASRLPTDDLESLRSSLTASAVSDVLTAVAAVAAYLLFARLAAKVGRA